METDPWRCWTSIRLEVDSKPLFSGRVWMHVGSADGQATLDTETTARFLGLNVSKTYTRSVMDPESGEPRSYVSYNPKRGRRYTFGADGYHVERILPESKPMDRLPEWTVSSSTRFAYPKDDLGKRLPVFDYYGMLLYLQRTDLAQVGDAVILHVATSSGPQPFRIQVAEIRAAELEYLELPSNVNRTATVREMRLQILPADPESDEGFLKMKGETELWVEAGSKTVLRIGGRAPKVGKITLVLAEMG